MEELKNSSTRSRAKLKLLLYVAAAILVLAVIVRFMYLSSHEQPHDIIRIDNVGCHTIRNVEVRANAAPVTILSIPEKASRTVTVGVIPESNLHLKYTDHLGQTRSEDIKIYLEGYDKPIHLSIDADYKLKIVDP